MFKRTRAAAKAIRDVNRAELTERKAKRAMWGVPAGKRDRNAAELDAQFLAAGATLMLLDGVGDGTPDRIVGLGGTDVLIEYKNPDGKNRMQMNQEVFSSLWAGSKPIECRTPADVATIIDKLRSALER